MERALHSFNVEVSVVLTDSKPQRSVHSVEATSRAEAQFVAMMQARDTAGNRFVEWGFVRINSSSTKPVTSVDRINRFEAGGKVLFRDSERLGSDLFGAWKVGKVSNVTGTLLDIEVEPDIHVYVPPQLTRRVS